MPQPTVCSVDECERDSSTHGWCKGHYHRWLKSGDVGPATFRRRAPIRVARNVDGPRCAVPVCDEATYGRQGRGEWCKAHYQRWLDNGTPGDTAIKKKRPDQGCKVVGCEKEHAVRGFCKPHYRRWWEKGDAGDANFIRPPARPTYGAAHQRLKIARGPANQYDCPCGKRATHWSYQYNDRDVLVDPRGYLYSDNVDCYAPMCTKCHKALDTEQRAKARRVMLSAPGGLIA